MNSPRLGAALMLSLAALGCGPQLSPELIRAHPSLRIVSTESKVVETSQPIRPDWLQRTEGQARIGDEIAFVGQAVAPTLELAQDQAARDLLSSVASFISVEVESQFESIETEKSGPGGTVATQDVRSVVRTRALATVRELKRDEVYWEKIAPASFAADQVSYRSFVFARLSRAQIEAARLGAELAQKREGGRRVIVLLPFASSLPESSVSVSRALASALARSLGGERAIHLVDPGAIERTIAEAKARGEDPLTRLLDTFVPDLIISGTVQLHEQRIRLEYALRLGADQSKIGGKSFIRPSRDLFELEQELEAALRKDLALEQSMKESAPAPVIIAERAAELEAARGLFFAGKNEAALAALRAAQENGNDTFEAQLFIGKVLERLGRYAHFQESAPALEPSAAKRTVQLDSCLTPAPYRTPPPPPASRSPTPSSETQGASVDGDSILHAVATSSSAALSRALVQIESSAVTTAMEAYGRALVLARRLPRGPEDQDVTLALADLAVRSDRLGAAQRLYEQLEARAVAAGDLHREALATLGLGVVARSRGAYPLAEIKLERARQIRLTMREKPYLLEVYNELGGLALDHSRFREARQRYTIALRLARDLEDDYYRAVIGNNVAILELLAGNTQRARELLEEAWASLERRDEAEGKISAALNLSWLLAQQGDRERAEEFIETTRKILLGTGQESRWAQLHDLEGTLRAKRRDPAAIDLLVRAWSSYQRLGRNRHRLRLENGIRVAEYLATTSSGNDPAERNETLRCLKRAYWTLLSTGWGAYPAFLLDRGQSDSAYWRAPDASLVDFTPPLIDPTELTYYAAELNAETLARLRVEPPR